MRVRLNVAGSAGPLAGGYNQHYPVPRLRSSLGDSGQVWLHSEQRVDVLLVLLLRFGDASNTENLSQVRAKGLNANLGQKLVKLVSRGSGVCLLLSRQLQHLPVAPSNWVVNVVNRQMLGFPRTTTFRRGKVVQPVPLSVELGRELTLVVACLLLHKHLECSDNLLAGGVIASELVDESLNTGLSRCPNNDCGTPGHFLVPELSFSVGANNGLADVDQDGDVIAEYGCDSSLLFRAGRYPLKFQRILDFFLKFRAERSGHALGCKKPMKRVAPSGQPERYPHAGLANHGGMVGIVQDVALNVYPEVVLKAPLVRCWGPPTGHSAALGAGLLLLLRHGCGPSQPTLPSCFLLRVVLGHLLSIHEKTMLDILPPSGRMSSIMFWPMLSKEHQMSILSAPYFHNEAAAYEFVEARLWPQGAICPKCGVIGNSYKMKGASTRLGVYKCRDCRKPFRVTVNTIFEKSHIPLNVWLQAIFLVASSKKGMSSNQLHRSLGISLKSAWFMSHRIREAMRSGSFDLFGKGHGTVEVDETFIGNDRTIKPEGEKRGRGFHHKNKVLSLVDRNSGQARSFVVDDVKASTIFPILQANLAREARLMTDESAIYRIIGLHYASHNVVRHAAGEYVSKTNPMAHTNTIEGFFSVFKRGMKGVYQHCDHSHLHRYLAEFDFRYNNRVANGVNDAQRADLLLKGVVGKRLTYETAAQ